MTSLDELRDPHKFAARFLHPEKYPVVERAGLSTAEVDDLAARLAGASLESLACYRAEFSREVQASAAEIIPGRQLPFEPGDIVLALGDSITDDSLSWASQLDAHLDAKARPAGVRVINAGITGNTTQEAVARVDRIIAAQPTWVIQMLGTNDARRHGRAEIKMQSLDETRRNLSALTELISTETAARHIVMTPPVVIERHASAWAPFRQERITWREADIDEIAEAVRQEAPSVVDVHRAFSSSTLDHTILPDGVHPTIAGQRLILETLLDALAV